MRKGSTWDEFRDLDLSHVFRRQNKRTLDEIDSLILRKEHLRNKLGEEKARDIDSNPDSFYNNERFRIWQAKARFRAFLSTTIIVPAIFTVLNNNRDGWGLMKRKWYLSVPCTIGTFMVTFFIWHRIVGYNNEAYYEQQYAKNVKMLRNLIIKQ